MNMFKSFLLVGMSVGAMTAFALPVSANADTFTATTNSGIVVNSSSRTKALNVMGKLDADTGIYTDTTGLDVPVNFDEVARANKLEPYTEPVPVVTITAPVGHTITPDQITVRPVTAEGVNAPTPEIRIIQRNASTPPMTGMQAKAAVTSDAAYTGMQTPPAPTAQELPVPNDAQAAASWSLKAQEQTQANATAAVNPAVVASAPEAKSMSTAQGDYVIEIKTPNAPIRMENDPNIYMPQNQVKVLTTDEFGEPIILDTAQYEKRSVSIDADGNVMTQQAVILNKTVAPAAGTASAATVETTTEVAATTTQKDADNRAYKFEDYDANKNGLISKDEFTIYEASIYAEDEFVKLDGNNDGYLERREFEQKPSKYSRKHSMNKKLYPDETI